MYVLCVIVITIACQCDSIKKLDDDDDDDDDNRQSSKVKGTEYYSE